MPSSQISQSNGWISYGSFWLDLALVVWFCHFCPYVNVVVVVVVLLLLVVVVLVWSCLFPCFCAKATWCGWSSCWLEVKKVDTWQLRQSALATYVKHTLLMLRAQFPKQAVKFPGICGQYESNHDQPPTTTRVFVRAGQQAWLPGLVSYLISVVSSFSDFVSPRNDSPWFTQVQISDIFRFKIL